LPFPEEVELLLLAAPLGYVAYVERGTGGRGKDPYLQPEAGGSIVLLEDNLALLLHGCAVMLREGSSDRLGEHLAGSPAEQFLPATPQEHFGRVVDVGESAFLIQA
jgi:hypothetical protein